MKSLISGYQAFFTVILILVTTYFSFAQGAHYKINMGVVDEEIPKKIIDQFNLVQKENSIENNEVYYVESLKSYQEASFIESQLKNAGYENAQIEAYFNQSKITIADALTLEDNHNNLDKENYLYSDEINRLVDAGVELNLYYSIQMNINETAVENTVLTKIEKKYQVVKEADDSYLIGEFDTMDKAKKVLEELSSSVVNPIITAYFNGQRISSLTAFRYEERKKMSADQKRN